MKIIKSLENTRILLKGTTRETTSEKRELLNFLRPLMTAGLQLTKSVLTPLAKSVLIPLGPFARISATDATIQKKICGSGTTSSVTLSEESLEESGLYE